MLRADSYPPDVWEAICTPMHEIVPAGAARPGTGALYLGSWTAAVDAELLAHHRVRAIVECLDAPWGMCESGLTSSGTGATPSSSSSHSNSTPVLGGTPSVGGAMAAHTISANTHAHQAPAFARAPTVPMPPGTGRPPISRAYTSAAIPTLSHSHSSSSSSQISSANNHHNHGSSPNHNGGNVGRFKVAIADSAAPDILTPHLDGAVRFINERLSRGENVLVHCQQVCIVLDLYLIEPF